MKKTASKLAHNQPKLFSVLGRAAHTAQEWIFMLEMCLKTHLFSNLWYKATLWYKWCWWPKMLYETQCIRTHHNIVWLYSQCSKMVVQSVQQYLLCPRMGLFSSLYSGLERWSKKKLWDKHINLSWLSFYSYFLMILKAFLLLSSSCNLEIRTCDKNSGYIQLNREL